MDLDQLPDLIDRSFEAVTEVEIWTGGDRSSGGTGFVARLDHDAGNSGDLVFTNAHVADAGTEMRVFSRNGQETSGKLLGTHPMVDIALFRLDEVHPSALELRGRNDFRLGEFVVALGHPQSFSWTATSGLISGVDRPDLDHASGLPITMLQTSAEITHGNSGGPLVGLDGKVIGVNTSGLTQRESLFKVNFAIPADSARLAAKAILSAEEEDHVPRPWTGLPIRNAPWKPPQDLVVAYGIKGGAEVGGDPEPGTPAGEADLHNGDVVIGIDSTPVDDPGDVYTWMLNPDCLEKEFELRYIRDGEVRSTTLRIIDRDSGDV